MMTGLGIVATIAKTDFQRGVAALQELKHPALLAILKAALTGRWRVGPNVNYEAARHGECAFLWDTARRLYLFCQLDRESPVANDSLKRHALWGRFLSEHAADECALLLLACQRRLPAGITPELCTTAFPELAQDAERDAAEVERQNATATYTAKLIAEVTEHTEVINQADARITELHREIEKCQGERNAASRKISLARSILGGLS